MSLVALVKTAKHLIVKKEPLKLYTTNQLGTCRWSLWLRQQTTYLYTDNHLFEYRSNCVNMSLVALVNTENHLFVRREPLISTQRPIVSTCPWSRWLTQQTTYLYAKNHLFEHRDQLCQHVLGRVG